jgi:hypothetical protein
VAVPTVRLPESPCIEEFEKNIFVGVVMKKFVIFSIIGCVVFLVTFRVRTSRPTEVAAIVTRPPADAPDSVQLIALGVKPGAQLVAYIFGGSRCGFCQKKETKQAFAGLRKSLTARYVVTGEFKLLNVVGVAVNSDVHEGLGYLESIGPDAFDQISTGSGWQNENVIRLVQQQHVAEAALPMIVLMSRSMTATLAPLKMTYSTDSVLKVVQGAQAIADWVRDGTDLVTHPVSRSTVGAETTPPPIGGRGAAAHTDARR